MRVNIRALTLVRVCRMTPYVADTMAAVSTAPGRGGIGILRVSGPGCRSIAEAVVGRVPDARVADVTGEGVRHHLPKVLGHLLGAP